ncbi:MAG: thioredoxin fold domain-containing protein [Bacteroidales bacterium]|nr:thioredoxin fold domain-containing protein [Bacteroidales bacterium]
MKKILIAILSIFLFASCGNNEKKDKKTEPIQEENIVVEEDTFVKTLDYKKFIKNVWDIETYPDSVVYKGKLPCVIDFYADWCGPCKKIAPIMEDIAREYDGKIIIYKVNVDKEPKLSTVFKIRNIPTVFFFPKEGQPLSQVGGLSKEEYTSIINKYLIN